MKIKRSAGVLMPVLSLAGNGPCGTMGQEARQFVDIISGMGFSYWQILPLHPVCSVHGYSPYTSISTFAGNPLQISIESLLQEQWISKSNREHAIKTYNSDTMIDYDSAMAYDWKFYEDLYDNCFVNDTTCYDLYRCFCNEQAFWIDDYSLFVALSDEFETNDWKKWPENLLHRCENALNEAKIKHAKRIEIEKFIQYIFFRQWHALFDYAHSMNVSIIGDIPIYVNFESADVWANQDIFLIDDQTGQAEVIAGVPPDYFSETGQRWGNPLYKWFDDRNELNKKTLEWWVKRISHLNRIVDVVRIDHFRAFESFWAIPGDEDTAVNGKWLSGPGSLFFEQIKEILGDLPLIAEDLGIITPEVEMLRDNFDLPGMKILQFAFDGNSNNTYLPHNIENPNCVIYTGTHDNNTTNGWYYGGELDENQKKLVIDYLGLSDDHDMHLNLIRVALMSTARLAIIPMQDIFGYGQEFRTNTPGLVGNNWQWRLENNMPDESVAHHIRHMIRIYAR